MIKILMERPKPPSFDLMDDAQVAAHCRIAVNGIAASGGKMHWLSTFATEDKLFGLVVVEDEQTLTDYLARVGVPGVKAHRVLKTLDASLAAPV